MTFKLCPGSSIRGAPSTTTASLPLMTVNSSSALGCTCCIPVPVNIPPGSTYTSNWTTSVLGRVHNRLDRKHGADLRNAIDVGGTRRDRQDSDLPNIREGLLQ